MLTKNTAKLKQAVAEHIAAETMPDRFIGCLAHRDDPSINEEIYGLPAVVQRITENIFEALPEDEARAFLASLPDAISCDGKDLSIVPWQFLAAELRSLPPQPDDIQAVIDPVIAGMDLLAQGRDWPAAEAAEAAVWAVWAGRAAARLRQRDLLLRLIAEAPAGGPLARRLT